MGFNSGFEGLMSFAPSLYQTPTLEVHIGSFCYVITHTVAFFDN